MDQGTCTFSGPPSSTNVDFFPFDPADCGPWEQLSLLSANTCDHFTTSADGAVSMMTTMGPPASAAMGCRQTLPFGVVWLPGVFIGATGLILIGLILARCFLPPRFVERCIASQRTADKDDSAKAAGARGGFDDGLLAVMESFSSVPFLFLVLTPASWTQYTCTTPKDFMRDPLFWQPLTTFPNWYIFPTISQLHRSGYTAKQKMALWALYYAGPNVTAAQCLIIIECCCFFYFLLSRAWTTSRRLAPLSFSVSASCLLFWLYFLFTQSGLYVLLWNSPFDPTITDANTFNQTRSPPVWHDPDGPEQIVCGLQGIWLVTIVPVIHYCSSIYFFHYCAPGVGSALRKSWCCWCRRPTTRQVAVALTHPG